MKEFKGEIKTTKKCPKCGNSDLVLFHTLDSKVCVNHDEFLVIPWSLDVNQKPLLTN